ncbi:uncharacterized protein I303_105454 [Kwoniella dejecticola CBS 10117]|uniref:Uncharacterized protein n=1 Tax=Kwoniella dejecticola CBS 10117 TaxID=1296121 RepID=A0A1A6A2G6_9TREE|nr:uncharacterized protein I303_05105 [Kwoniella dejecticola CBS 10117]OBR84248.1 hypothetical protein I303_05105 [Kwoniella dejecticola CBS 10117]
MSSANASTAAVHSTAGRNDTGRGYHASWTDMKNSLGIATFDETPAAVFRSAQGEGSSKHQLTWQPSTEETRAIANRDWTQAQNRGKKGRLSYLLKVDELKKQAGADHIAFQSTTSSGGPVSVQFWDNSNYNKEVGRGKMQFMSVESIAVPIDDMLEADGDIDPEERIENTSSGPLIRGKFESLDEIRARENDTWTITKAFTAPSFGRASDEANESEIWLSRKELPILDAVFRDKPEKFTHMQDGKKSAASKACYTFDVASEVDRPRQVFVLLGEAKTNLSMAFSDCQWFD